MIILSPQALTDPTGVAQAVALQVRGQAARSSRCGWAAKRWPKACGSSMSRYPHLRDPEQAVDTFMEMYFYSRHLRLLQETRLRCPRI